VGLIVAYNLFFVIGAYFGLDPNVPIRSYDDKMVFTVFALGLLTLSISLYLFSALSASIYYGFKFSKGHINKDEYINIVFKGLYPSRWQKLL
jgi:hypothetical protein